MALKRFSPTRILPTLICDNENFQNNSASQAHLPSVFWTSVLVNNMASVGLSKILFVLLVTYFSKSSSLNGEFGKKYVFSDKTPYHFLNESVQIPKNYEPIFINMIIRHGSRYPSTHRVQGFDKYLKVLNRHILVNRMENTTIPSTERQYLPWEIPMDVKNAASKELSKLGAQEMYEIARRVRFNFPQLFNFDYSNNNYSFIATDKLRSSQSAVSFAQGLFEYRGNVGDSRYQPVAIKSSGPSHRDRVLRIYEACPKWRNKIRFSEYRKFLSGEHMRKVTENIRTRLNLHNKTLSPQAVVEMYLMCAFGTQTDSKDVSLCSLFSDDDFRVLEYLNDLKVYWSYGYGRKINSRMACLLYRNLLLSFNQHIQISKPYGVFQFAHTGTVVPLLTLLGLFQDEQPLRSDNFPTMQNNRTFRPSDIVPMSANVAFVLYDRSRNATKSKHARPKSSFSRILIQVLVNEVVVKVPACKGKKYCRLKKFVEFYSSFEKNCNIRKICGSRKHRSRSQRRNFD